VSFTSLIKDSFQVYLRSGPNIYILAWRSQFLQRVYMIPIPLQTGALFVYPAKTKHDFCILFAF